jgi:ABC-2 type transport system permease protein
LARALYLRRDIDAVAISIHPRRRSVGRRSRDPTDTLVLTSVRALAMRLQLGLIAGWVVGIGAGGLAYGLVVSVMEDFIADNEQLAEFMDAANGASPVESMIGASAKYLAVMAGAFAVQSALSLRREEGEGRAELLLALPVTRRRYWNSFAAPTVVGSLAVLGAGGVLLGLGSWVSTGDSATFVDGSLAVLAYAPAVLLFAAVAGLLFGWRPHWSLMSWAVYAAAASISMFGPMLQLPGWAMNLSVFDAIPMMPSERLSPAPLLAVSAAAVVLFLVGRAGFESRDLETA